MPRARLQFVRLASDTGPSSTYVPFNLCALCGRELRPMPTDDDADDAAKDSRTQEELFKLDCGHESVSLAHAREMRGPPAAAPVGRSYHKRMRPNDLQVSRELHPRVDHGGQAGLVPHLLGEGAAEGHPQGLAVAEGGARAQSAGVHVRASLDLRVTSRPAHPRQTIMWSNMLDLLRYLVVWNPLILIFIQLAARMLGLTGHAHTH